MTHEILFGASAATIAIPALAVLYARRGTLAAAIATTIGLVALIVVALCLAADLLAPAPIDGTSLLHFDSEDVALFGAGAASNLVALATLVLGMAGVIPRAIGRQRLVAAWVLLELPLGLALVFRDLGSALSVGLFPALTLGLVTLVARGRTRTRQGAA